MPRTVTRQTKPLLSVQENEDDASVLDPSTICASWYRLWSSFGFTDHQWSSRAMKVQEYTRVRSFPSLFSFTAMSLLATLTKQTSDLQRTTEQTTNTGQTIRRRLRGTDLSHRPCDGDRRTSRRPALPSTEFRLGSFVRRAEVERTRSADREENARLTRRRRSVASATNGTGTSSRTTLCIAQCHAEGVRRQSDVSPREKHQTSRSHSNAQRSEGQDEERDDLSLFNRC